MNNSIIFIGKIFKLDKFLREYVLDEAKELIEFDNISFFDEFDKNLFSKIEYRFNDSQNVLIVTNKSSFSLIGKFICTLTGDSQSLRDGVLIPSKVKNFNKKSYVLYIKNTKVNILEINIGEELPLISLKSDKNTYLHILNDSNANLVLNPLAKSFDLNLVFIPYIKNWDILEIKSKKYGNIKSFITHSKKLLVSNIIDEFNITKFLIRALIKRGEKISFAESCTGGLLSALLTSENGASEIFDGSIISYSKFFKNSILKVDNKTLDNYGEVSEFCIQGMLRGAKKISNADYILALSGIAGTKEKEELNEIGTIYIGVSYKDKTKIEKFLFKGNRNYIQKQSLIYAIKMLFDINQELLAN